MRFTSFLYAGLLLATRLLSCYAADDEVERNVERLRSSEFEEREEGTRALIAAGERSVAAARRAAVDGDLEVRVRAIRVLVSIAVAPEEGAAREAEAALDELAKDKNVPVAKLARDSQLAVKEFRREERQKQIAALRKLGGTALLNESGEVYRIDFEGQYITDEGLKVRRTVRVRGKLDEDDLPAKVGELTEVEFAAKYVVKTRVTDKELAILKIFPAVTYLNMQQTECSDAGLVHLKSLRKLEYLTLNKRITDEGLAHLANLKELKSLGLAQTQITGAGFAHLAGLARLEEIEMSNSQVDDAGLEVITRNAGLLALKLGNTRVTDEGANHLSRLCKLNLLTLHHTGISDAGLRTISTLEDLRSLTLDATKVTDTGIGHLAGLKHLQGVSFTEPLVTKAGVEKLRAEMPKTSVYLWPETPRR
ncbi:MAG: hypothetical protein IAF94_20020 [Pirellulaceae bacterium]|nr:hypothetical protein [Pirellulaceae bacterium]